MNFFEKASRYAGQMMRREPELLKELRETTARELRYDDMLSGPVVGSFLGMLVRISGARSVLEIGTFTGYATLWMAAALPKDGKLVTCETNEKYARIARLFFERFRKETVGLTSGQATEPEIQLCMGPALDAPWPEQLDFVFLDADKEHYPEYYERIMPRLAPGGLLVVDNAFWGGKVWGSESDTETMDTLAANLSETYGEEEKTRVRNVPADRQAAAIDRLNRMIADDSRVENVVLSVRDGLHLVRKIP